MLRPAVNLFVDHVDDQIAAVDAIENLLPVRIHLLALLVHHLVVVEQVLSHVEVAFFDLLLGPFDPLADHAAFNGFPFLHAQPSENVLDPFSGEDSHQIVFQGQEETARTGIALAAAAPAQLQVDAPSVVTLGPDHVQPTHVGHLAAFSRHPLPLGNRLHAFVPHGFWNVQAGLVLPAQLIPRHVFRIAAQDDIGTASSHVGRNGHGVVPARLSDDLCLTPVMLGIQDVVLDAVSVQLAADEFGLLDRYRADQNRTPRFVDFANLVNDRVPLFPL